MQPTLPCVGRSEPDAALVEFLRGLPPGRAVDLGAGCGRNALWLSRQGWQVTAVDRSLVDLQQFAVQAGLERLSVKTVLADLNEFLARRQRFDLVVLANLHPPLEQRVEFFASAAASVDAGGHLYFSGHHADSSGRSGPPDPRCFCTQEALRHGFPGLQVLQAERRLRNGRPGDAIHIDAVAWAIRPA